MPADATVMTGQLLQKPRVRIFGEYVLAVVLCLLILTLIMQLWRADLRIPFTYTGDSLVYSTFIKGIVENGWHFHNPSIGVPGGLEMYDFPLPDNFHFLLIKFLSLFTSNHEVILNLFFLLTFPLTTLASLFVFRQFGISYLPSLFGSLLYTFQPYHFFRGEGHLFYSAYYMVPLMVLIVLWVYQGRLQVIRRGDGKRGKTIFDFRNWRAIFSLFVAIIIASTGAYYSFFGCFLLLVAGVLAIVRHRGIYPLVTALILVGVISFTTALNLSRSIIYLREHGNPQSMARNAGEAERFGLKIAQMLLPITAHRVPFMAKLKHDYSHAPLTNENNNASLGLIGAAGFLLLLGVLFNYRRTSESGDENDLLPILSKLNLATLLLATIGGFGSLFALIVSPHIRSYNRISIYIAFFALFAIVLLLEGFARRRVATRNGRIVFASALGLLLLLGVLDQTNKHFRPDYKNLTAAYTEDQRFITRVEQTVPSQSMIFQLPYVPFPEFPPVHEMLDYDHLKAYVHSKSVRWTYGAIRGRYSDEWQKTTSFLPAPQFLETLAVAGFNGLYIDRFGYEDKGAKIESEFAKLTGITPITSDNGRLAFFPLVDYNNQVRNKYSEQEWLAKKEAVFPSLMFYWRNGFWDLEYTQKGELPSWIPPEENTPQKNLSEQYVPEENWRWCAGRGEFHIYNRTDREIKVALEMSFSTVNKEYSDLTITGRLHSDKLQINNEPRPYTMNLTVPPGHNVIEFASNARPVDLPTDPRDLVFRVNNFRFKEIK